MRTNHQARRTDLLRRSLRRLWRKLPSQGSEEFGTGLVSLGQSRWQVSDSNLHPDRVYHPELMYRNRAMRTRGLLMDAGAVIVPENVKANDQLERVEVVRQDFPVWPWSDGGFMFISRLIPVSLFLFPMALTHSSRSSPQGSWVSDAIKPIL